jgi:hypothetical protein
MPFDEIAQSLELTIRGAKDASGKTPFDLAIERTHLDDASTRTSFINYLMGLFPSLIEKGPEHLRLGRQLVRRLQISDRRLADTLRRTLTQPMVREQTEIRLWISLTLMDLGFPRTVASLRNDEELRRRYVGEWLTLVSANENYADVKNAYVELASGNLLSADQLLVKADIVRRQFGGELFDFLKSVVSALHSKSDREKVVQAVKKMYGMNLERVTKSPRQRHKRTLGSIISSLSPKTINLLQILGREAEDRKEEGRRVA